MNLINLRKEARRAILVDGITHSEFFKNFTDKYDLNKEKIAKEISHIPSEEKIKKNKFVRTLYLIICVLLLWLSMSVFALVALSKSGLSQISKDFYMDYAVGVYIIMSLPAVFAFLAFFSHKTNHYYVCGAIMSVYALNGMYNQNAIFTIAVLIPAILSFYIPSLLKLKYEKKHMTFNSDDGNETVSIEYQFED